VSFTEDELQSFNTILEQRLLAHRQEMERAFDQRLAEYRRETEQRLIAVQQEVLRQITLKLAEIANQLNTSMNERFQVQQIRVTQALNQDGEQRRQQFESALDRMLAAQLLGIEQLLNQQLTLQGLEDTVMTTGGEHAQLETIELQTELPWEDLAEEIGKVLDERLANLNETTQRALFNLEQYLSVRLHSLQDEILHRRGPQQEGVAPSNIQEVLHGIEHLERIIESLQVAMTANHALLSNRLFHHQQLPLERAHPGGALHSMPTNGTALSLAKERIASGLEPGLPSASTQVEEQREE
jgi:hypothetical protein